MAPACKLRTVFWNTLSLNHLKTKVEPHNSAYIDCLRSMKLFYCHDFWLGVDCFAYNTFLAR